MKKTIKRVTAFIAAICIIGGLTIHACNPASVSAAAPKFSKKKITLRVGKTKTLKIKNADKKVSFSISNKNARLTVKSKYRCVIKGKHAGKCILTAKCGNRKLKCRITVKEKKNIWNDNIINAATPAPVVSAPPVNQSEYDAIARAKEAETRVESIHQFSESGEIVGIYTNKNDFSISISPKMTFFNSSGLPIDSSTVTECKIAPGKTITAAFKKKDRTSYASYSVTLNTKLADYTDYSDNLDVLSYPSERQSKAITVSCTNKGNLKMNTVTVYALFYDDQNHYLGRKGFTLTNIEPGAYDFSDISYEFTSAVTVRYQLYVQTK